MAGQPEPHPDAASVPGQVNEWLLPRTAVTKTEEAAQIMGDKGGWTAQMQCDPGWDPRLEKQALQANSRHLNKICGLVDSLRFSIKFLFLIFF